MTFENESIIDPPGSNNNSTQNGAHVTTQPVVAAVAKCTLAPFWWADPELWFVCAEANFTSSTVTSDLTKYNLVLATLDHETVRDVSDVVRSPPQTGKLNKLLTNMELGDLKPTQLLRRVRDLAGQRVGDDVLRIRWLNLLPTPTQRLLKVFRGQSLEQITEAADELHELGPGVMAVSTAQSHGAAATSGLSTLSSPPFDPVQQELAAIRKSLAQLLSRMAALEQNASALGRSRSRSRGGNSDKQRAATPLARQATTPSVGIIAGLAMKLTNASRPVRTTH